MIERAKRDGKHFLNPVPSTVGGFSLFIKVLWRYLTGREERVPKQKLGPFRTDPQVYDIAPASGLRVTWMGHSSSLLEIDGARILIDPVWEKRQRRLSGRVQRASLRRHSRWKNYLQSIS